MTEASSSSSSSVQLDNVGTPIGKRPRSESFCLAIRTQPPSFVFPGERFELEFAVEGGSSSASPPTDVEVVPSLTNISPEASKSDCALEILETPRISPSRKTGTIKCVVRNPSVTRKHGCSLQIHIRVNQDRDIASCTTRTISLVNAKLHVTMSADWANIWFKDEGGRDKCMEGDVTLWNDRNQTFSEHLLLDLKLCYAGENCVSVSNQDLLRRIGADQQFQIDPVTGTGKVRYRVEDVSKNHQGQNFVVRISPGKGSIRDIAPAYTPPVSVRSKRNRQKQKSTGRQNPLQDQTPGDLSLPTPTSDSGRRSSFGEHRLFEGTDPVRLRNAVQAVVRWADEVVNSLYYMQWQVIGYEHRSDGSMDYNRPLHNIQNPNPTIDRVLAIYNETVRDDLGFLQGALEQSSTPSVSVGSMRTSPYAAAAGPPQQAMQLGGGHSHTPPYNRGMPPQAYARPAQNHPGDFHSYPSQPMPQQQLHPQQQAAYQQQFFYPHDQQQSLAAKSSPRDPSPLDDGKVASSIDRESEVEFVLAKQYKSVRTGERLGFPAYSAVYELLGFYRESANKVGASHFVTLRPQDFGPNEKQEAQKILEAAIENKSNAVHALKDWGSMARLIDHCLVYNFSKDIDDST
eukprot:CAMPEP_0172457494 /NCGR_PEP_ID=MMETSP1065-20121228/22650_1 /TAXON_ID=265537 /ORGANISM="Amphiprora paludosa, Strain CCMP125" /LENGTH=627 /DNA_ID=CAMNT_0013211281 /DNA_START=155 /DNA_END=2035 /DNA_ORIENTATION=-